MVAFEKSKIWGWGTPHFWGMLGKISKFERKYLSPQGVLGGILLALDAQSIGAFHIQSWRVWVAPWIFGDFFCDFFGLKIFPGTILKIVNIFFPETFCADREAILLCYEINKKGGCSMKCGTLAPTKWPTILANYEKNCIINSGRGL